MSKHHGLHVHKIRDWEQRGRDAFHAGIPLDLNPAQDMKNAKAWEIGWTAEADYADNADEG